MTAALEARGLRVRFGAVEAVRGVDLTLAPGTVTGLIGPNGAGKTTVVDALMGFVPLAAGDVALDGHSIDALPPHQRAARGVTRTFQTVELFEDLTVAENVQVAAEARHPTGGTATDQTLTPDGAAPDALARDLSPSGRKTLALARALATRPRVLLLDEPAAGLDRAERQELARTVRQIADRGTAVLVVDHDLRLILDLCDEVVVLDLGAVVFRGTPQQLRADPQVAAAYLGERPAEVRGPTPPRVDAPAAVATHGLRAGYGDVTIVDGVDLHVGAGEIVALLGPNGAGKTTLLLALSGQLAHVAGAVEVLGRPLPRRPQHLARRGVATVLQQGKLFTELTVAENLRLAAGRHAVDDAVARFPAVAPLLGQRAGALSGGEQQLVALARALTRAPRLLIVDELSLGVSAAAMQVLLDALADLRTQTGAAVLFAEQHAHHALGVADRAYVLAAGRVVLEDTAAALAAAPERLAAAYLGAGQ